MATTAPRAEKVRFGPSSITVLLVDGFFDSSESWIRRTTTNVLNTIRRVEAEPLLEAAFAPQSLSKKFGGIGDWNQSGIPITVTSQQPGPERQSCYKLIPEVGDVENCCCQIPEFLEDLEKPGNCRTLLVLCPEWNDQTHLEHLHRLLSPVRRGPVVRELLELRNMSQVNAAANSSCSLERGLAMAQHVRNLGGTSLVLWNGGPDEDFHTVDWPQAHDPVRYFTFHIAAYHEFNEKLLGSLTLRRKAGFKQSERRGARDRNATQSMWKDWGLDPDSEVRRLMDFEFSHHETFDIFNMICREASGEIVEGTETTRYHRILLAAVRLCKRLANKTLEGTPFDFTLFIPAPGKTREFWIKRCCQLASRDTSADSRTSPDLNPVASLLHRHARPDDPEDIRESDFVCDPKDWVCFTFDFEEQASNHAELSQSPELALLLDPETGVLTYLLQKESPFTLDPLRFAQFANFFHQQDEQHCGVFLQGIGGRVELHARLKGETGKYEDTFCLEYNGFKWIPQPLHELRSTLLRKYPFTKKSENEGIPPIAQVLDVIKQHVSRFSLAHRLEQAIATLLLHQKSSLIMLCHESDLELLRESFNRADAEVSETETGSASRHLSLSPLRNTVKVIRCVNDTNPVPLAGLLQVDGLHVLSSIGDSNEANGGQESGQMVSYFACRVMRSREGSNTPAPVGPVGSGTSTAYELHDAFKNSHVIKVSASGAIKILKPEN